MTSKIVLKAAKEQYERKYEGCNFAPWEALGNSSKESYINSAQAVFDSAKILILPHDAEPIEGDYVKYRPKESPHWKDGRYYQIDKLRYIGDTPLKTLGHYRLDECEILSIVYRDGYKAVIQEEKDNEHIQD